MAEIGKVFQSLEAEVSAVARGAAAEIIAEKADSFVAGGTPAHHLRRVISGGTTAIAQSTNQEEKREVDPCQPCESFNIFECIFEAVIEFFKSGSPAANTNEFHCSFGNRICIN